MPADMGNSNGKNVRSAIASKMFLLHVGKVIPTMLFILSILSHGLVRATLCVSQLQPLDWIVIADYTFNPGCICDM